ncbi:hypothetical protein [Streptomyces sp. NPDC002671]
MGCLPLTGGIGDSPLRRTARRAPAKIVVGYEVFEPITDPERAAHDDTLPKLHPGGNVVRYQPVIKGDLEP